MQQPDLAANLAVSSVVPTTGALDPAEVAVGCPLHFAMARLAELAVQQHVLYEQGEYTPRPELLRALAQWTQLHELIAAQVCPASRQTAPDPVSLDRALRDLPDSLRAQLRATLRRCATHDEEGGCPLAAEPRARLLGCSDTSAVH